MSVLKPNVSTQTKCQYPNQYKYRHGSTGTESYIYYKLQLQMHYIKVLLYLALWFLKRFINILQTFAQPCNSYDNNISWYFGKLRRTCHWEEYSRGRRAGWRRSPLDCARGTCGPWHHSERACGQTVALRRHCSRPQAESLLRAHNTPLVIVQITI